MCIIDIEVSAEPIVNDTSLQVEPVITGMKFPTSMAFIGPNDILVLEKNRRYCKKDCKWQLVE